MSNMVEMTIEKIDEVKSRLGRTLGASMRLRDLIRKVRAAKTAAEERSVVERESANIRDAFRDEDSKYRCRDMAKLFYIHMLGYPAHFGQMECMKLVGTKDKRFTDIRIGYLGAMLLLDERSEVHLLVTNCLKSHLSESDQFVTGLALCTLGSICSVEMCRDLSPEVDKLLTKTTNAYIKKKAALCAFRIIRKVPELISCFMSGVRSLMNEKNHGVLIGGLTLMTEMCEKSPDVKNHFRNLVPQLVKKFRDLLGSGYSAEHDINSVTDPFLQVKILRLLRVLGKDDVQASEAMNDLLTQIATNTDTTKNVGNAVLYETVLTIMEIKSESGLKVVGTNVLGRYLLNTDKNIRYVALNTLLKATSVDLNTIQRYRGTVVDNLKDPDVSIRRRALELSFYLINRDNIELVAKEILLFLQTADPEFKGECASKMYVAAERFSPNHIWHLNTMICVLKLAGNHVPEEVVSAMIQLISANPTIQAYATKNLFRAAREDYGLAQPLLQVAFWCIGEFGDMLIAPSDTDQSPPTENEVVEFFAEILALNSLTIITREYSLISLGKLAIRFNNSSDKIEALIKRYISHINLELQQRSVETVNLLRRDELKHGVLERMPVIEHNNLNAAAAPIETDDDGVRDSLLGDSQPAQEKNELFDLMAEPAPTTSKPSSALEDLLGLMNGNSAPAPAAAAPPTAKPVGLGNDFADLFGGPAAQVEENVENEEPGMIVYNQGGLEVQLFVESNFSVGDTATLRFEISNNTNQKMERVHLQAAVTKAFQIEIQAASSPDVEPHGNSATTQIARIRRIGDSSQQLKIRMKLNYDYNGEQRAIQQDISAIPGL